jgi:hypothetical protein
MQCHINADFRHYPPIMPIRPIITTFAARTLQAFLAPQYRSTQRPIYGLLAMRLPAVMRGNEAGGKAYGNRYSEIRIIHSS